MNGLVDWGAMARAGIKRPDGQPLAFGLPGLPDLLRPMSDAADALRYAASPKPEVEIIAEDPGRAHDWHASHINPRRFGGLGQPKKTPRRRT